MVRALAALAVFSIACSHGDDATSTRAAPTASTPKAAAPAPAAPGGPGGADPADCDRLASKLSAMSMALTPAGTPDDRRARLQQLSDEAGAAIGRLCKTDGWTQAAVTCGLAAKNPSLDCDDQLTAAQKNRMQAEVQAIFSRGLGGMVPPAP